MAKRGKKSLSQRAVSIATPGVPGPLRSILTSRIGAPLTVLVGIALATAGVVKLDWSGGWPRLAVDRQRVGEIRQKVEAARGDATPLPAEPAAIPATPVSQNAGPGDTVRVASFNIQVLGTSKAGKPHVMSVLADVIRRFDVVAIQELRTTDMAVMDSLLQQVNQGGAKYQYVAGPRLGRTVSKEQYVFVFNPDRVELLPNTALTLEDPQDLLHREPLIAHFRARTSGPSQPFTFILVNVHTDPDETGTELDALAEAFLAVQQNPWQEDDVILLGDLNVDYRKLGKLGTLPDISYTVQGQATNTRGDASYDNIVFNRVATQEFTGTAGVIDLQNAYGLTTDQALEVSDHLPVWAEFRMFESGSADFVAGRPSPPLTDRLSPPVPPGNAPPIQPPADNTRRTGLRGLFDRTTR
ncbi:MAG: endonuclease/exonuclease/phosphatase family protein [Pirellulales bacterium]|nr:endonuclease/exonuclease/phosphatase family protein [Pirellulales bacterium]